MFIDRVRIFAQAGDGGNGCVSFRREKFVPKGGPDGGDGGRGGNVVLVADSHVDNLVSLYYQPIVKARKGGNGMGKKMSGKNGADTEVKIPVGTMVFRLPISLDAPDFPDAEENESEDKNAEIQKAGCSRLASLAATAEFVADLNEPGQRLILCHGGEGGRGNVHFKSSTNRVPRHATSGAKGEFGNFLLELRLIADAGLVGFPNAGKSSLLAAVSAARPKIASYPFTTLRPSVGVIELPGYRKLSLADIPGLIEGAHQNRGLGHDFLRHILRCATLVFVVDMAGSERRNPLEDFAAIKKELVLFNPVFAKRPAVVAANKMDLPDSREYLEKFRKKYRALNVFPVCAKTGEGVAALVEAISRLSVR